MIIKGPELHHNSWQRLTGICEILYTKLEKATNQWRVAASWPARSLDYSDMNVLDEMGINAGSYSSDALILLEEARNTLETISTAVRLREAEGLRESLEDFFMDAFDVGVEVEESHDEVMEILSNLEIREGKLLYLPTETLVQIPNPIISISEDLLRALVKEPELPYSVHPRKFEEIIAEIFLRNGFDVELTKTTRDGGKDIIAFYNKMGITTKYVIECKRYSKSNKVSLAIVQRLLGVKIATKANKGILATTSTFTADAVKFTSDNIWDLELKDYDDIVSWLKFAVG